MSESIKAEPLSLPPLYDTNTFKGRFQHFAAITDWRLCSTSTRKLQEAQILLREKQYDASSKELRKASALYQSAFHPDTGELQNIFGRMSFQVPGGMLLTGAMLAFYRSTPAVIFWQWANQSFNALVNYTNRSATSELSTSQLVVAYSSATTAALGSAIGLKTLLSGSKKLVILQRFVPFIAVASANLVNIPLMRQSELTSGVNLLDENGNYAAKSKVAAAKGIGQVTFSRIVMAAPGMLLLPLLMRKIELQRWYRPAFNLPLQTLLCGVSLTLMVPLSCSFFNQKCTMDISTLKSMEPESYKELQEKYNGNPPSTYYFNKGL